MKLLKLNMYEVQVLLQALHSSSNRLDRYEKDLAAGIELDQYEHACFEECLANDTLYRKLCHATSIAMEVFDDDQV